MTPSVTDYLRAIASLGGNLEDDLLTNKTGANDAAHRGLMYCEARRLAREALESIKGNRFQWRVMLPQEPAMEFATEKDAVALANVRREFYRDETMPLCESAIKIQIREVTEWREVSG